MDSQVQTDPEPPHKSKNILAVYAYLIIGLIITGGTVALCYQLENVVSLVRSHFIITLALTTGLLTLNLSLFNKLKYPEDKGKKILCWVLNCLLSGIPLLEVDEEILVKSTIYTIILVLILSLKSFIIPAGILNSLIYPMTAIHTVVLVCTIYSLLFGFLDTTASHLMTTFCLHGGFFVYSALLICNTQRLCLSAKYSRFDPMFSAFVMYMNIMNLYSRLATFCSIETEFQEKKCV